MQYTVYEVKKNLKERLAEAAPACALHKPQKRQKLGVGHGFVLSVSLGAREVDADPGVLSEFGMEILLDGREGAEEPVAGLGQRS